MRQYKSPPISRVGLTPHRNFEGAKIGQIGGISKELLTYVQRAGDVLTAHTPYRGGRSCSMDIC